MSDLRKYAVHMDVGASIVIEVDASSADEAIDRAWTEAHLPSLCHHCSRHLDLHDFTGIVDAEELEE
jgi:hypothetical protein